MPEIQLSLRTTDNSEIGCKTMNKSIKSALFIGILTMLSPLLTKAQSVVWPTLKCEVTSSQFTKSPFPPLVHDTILFQAWNDQQIELIFEPHTVNPESNISYVITPQPLQLTTDQETPNPIRKWSTEFQNENEIVLQELTLLIKDNQVIGRFEQIETQINNKSKKSIDSFDLKCE